MQSQPALGQQDPSPHHQDTQFYRATLHELIELGTGLARDIAAQAKHDTTARASDPDAPRPDPTIAFDRIARTVRRCILMAQHIAKPVSLQPAHAHARAQAHAHAQVIRNVEDAIHRARTPNNAALQTEFRERLDAPELLEALEHDLATRPIADIVEEITRDLGIAAMPGTDPFRRRTPQDLKALFARATQTGEAPHLTPGHPAPRPQARP